MTEAHRELWRRGPSAHESSLNKEEWVRAETVREKNKEYYENRREKTGAKKRERPRYEGKLDTVREYLQEHGEITQAHLARLSGYSFGPAMLVAVTYELPIYEGENGKIGLLED